MFIAAVAGLCSCASAPEGLASGSTGKPQLVVYRVQFDAAAMAEPMGLSADEVTSLFRNGRPANFFLRLWADRRLAPVAGDAVASARLKTMTDQSDVQFQRSARTGAQREADQKT